LITSTSTNGPFDFCRSSGSVALNFFDAGELLFVVKLLPTALLAVVNPFGFA
jgi:hypothetical protein